MFVCLSYLHHISQSIVSNLYIPDSGGLCVDKIRGIPPTELFTSVTLRGLHVSSLI